MGQDVENNNKANHMKNKIFLCFLVLTRADNRYEKITPFPQTPSQKSDAELLIGVYKEIYEMKSNFELNVNILEQKMKALEVENENLRDLLAKMEKSKSATRFSASLSSNVKGNTNQIKFDTVSMNVGGGYDPNTGIFTAPNDGTYYFSAQVYKYNGAGGIALKFKRTGVFETTVSDYYHAPNADENMSQTALLELNSGDQVYVKKFITNEVLKAGNGAIFHGNTVGAIKFYGFQIKLRRHSNQSVTNLYQKFC